MNRGAGRCDTFLDDRDRIEFGRVLGRAAERFGVEVHVYCLMSNHFHLLVRCPDGRLSEFMQFLGSRYTREFNDRHETDGALMRGRFTSREVLTDDHLLAAFRYIHLNPVALLAGAPLDRYRWSSLRAYLGYRRPPDWFRIDHFVDWLGGTGGVADLVGSEGRCGVSVDTLAQLAPFALDEFGCEGPRAERTGLLLLAERLPDRAPEIASLLGFSDSRQLSKARSRARSRARSDGDLRLAIDILDRAA